MSVCLAHHLRARAAGSRARRLRAAGCVLDVGPRAIIARGSTAARWAPILVALLLSASGALGAAPVAAAAGDYAVEARETALPEGLADELLAALSPTALTVLRPDGEPLMDLWFVGSLPAPTSPPPDPAVNYGSVPEGAVLGVMRLHAEHRDYRDQAVPAGVYVMRYLQQPADGNHLGETTFRDFAVLVPTSTVSSAQPQDFVQTLEQALGLNTHPLVWGLWPADLVVAPTVPGIVNFEPDKWGLRVDLPRKEGDTVQVALVVVGNERSFY